MANDKKAKAEKVYKTMVKALKAKNWKFAEHENDLTIVSSYTGEDIPITYLMRVDSEREVVQYLSPLPFKIEESKRIDAAVAVCVANYGLVNGSFDFDITDGEIRYRLTTSFCDSELGEGFFYDMMATAVITTDNYNDKFMMLNKGLITLQQFIDAR